MALKILTKEEKLIVGQHYFEVRYQAWRLATQEKLRAQVKAYVLSRIKGSLVVTIEPAEARSAGAQWRLTNGPDTGWKSSGETVSNLPVGTYTVTFKDIPGWIKPADATVRIVAGQTFTLSVSYKQSLQFAFDLVVQPNSSSVPRGGSVPVTVRAWKTSGSDTSVSFVVTGLPSGVTVSPQSWSWTLGDRSQTLTFSVGASVPLGTYNITIQGTGGGVTKTVTFALTVTAPSPFAFDLIVQPNSSSVSRGGSVSVTVRAWKTSGSDTSVSFVVTGLPSGVTVSPQSWSWTLGDRSQTLTFSVGANVPPGTYNITIQGTGGGVTKTVLFALTVIEPSPPTIVSVTPSPSRIAPGGTVTLTYTVSNPRPTTQVILGASIRLPGGPTLSDPYNDRKITLAPGTNTVTRAFTVPTTAPSGAYDLLVSLVDDVNNNGRIDSGDRNLDFKTFYGAITVTSNQPRLTLEKIEPSVIETSQSTYVAELKLTGSGFLNVTEVVFRWDGPDSGSRTWTKGDSRWNSGVTVYSDSLMILRPQVLYNVTGSQRKTWTWTVTLKDNTGATVSGTFTVIYKP